MKSRKATSPARPLIWSEGRQHPPLDFRAFGRATLAMSRESEARLLVQASAATGSWADAVASGRWRVPEARLGRTGRFLPHHTRVADWLEVLGKGLERGATLASGAGIAPEPGLSDVPAPARPAAPLRAAAPAADGDLAAIRQAIAAAEPATAAVRFAPLEDAAPRAPGRMRGVMVSGLGLVFAWGLLPLVLPWGAGRAVVAHLQGQDLRQQDA